MFPFGPTKVADFGFGINIAPKTLKIAFQVFS